MGRYIILLIIKKIYNPSYISSLKQYYVCMYVCIFVFLP